MSRWDRYVLRPWIWMETSRYEQYSISSLTATSPKPGPDATAEANAPPQAPPFDSASPALRRKPRLSLSILSRRSLFIATLRLMHVPASMLMHSSTPWASFRMGFKIHTTLLRQASYWGSGLQLKGTTMPQFSIWRTRSFLISTFLIQIWRTFIASTMHCKTCSMPSCFSSDASTSIGMKSLCFSSMLYYMSRGSQGHQHLGARMDDWESALYYLSSWDHWHSSATSLRCFNSQHLWCSTSKGWSDEHVDEASSPWSSSPYQVPRYGASVSAQHSVQNSGQVILPN